MKKRLSPGIAVLVVVLALVGVGVAYWQLMPKEKPLSKGAITPDQAPPMTGGVKPTPSAR